MATQWPPGRAKGVPIGSLQDGETGRAWVFESQIAKHFLFLGNGPGEPLRAVVATE